MMRFLKLSAALFVAASYGATYSGFLQNREDVEMDTTSDQRVRPASSTTRNPLGRVGKQLGAALACVALGGAGGWTAANHANKQAANIQQVVGLSQAAPSSSDLPQSLASVIGDAPPTSSMWAQGYRKDTQVYRQQVPVAFPHFMSTKVPGSEQDGYTLVHSSGGAGLLSEPICPGGSGQETPSPPDASAPTGPGGWKWPKNGAEIGFDQPLIGTVVEYDMVNFGQIHCGCQANIYLTKAPGNNQPQTCDAGGNGYGCYELDFMEGNAQAIGTTLHLCGDQQRGDFMCSDDRCLSSKIPSKKGGGDECDSWGCATNTKDLPDKEGKKAYGKGGYIDSDQNFKMSVYFEASGSGNELEHVWVRLAQSGKDLIYKVCDADNYIRAYTEAAKTAWTTQSTYWGGGDGMEWLNGPCWDAPGWCGGNAADHVQNVKLYKAVK